MRTLTKMLFFLLLLSLNLQADSETDSVKYTFDSVVITATKVKGAQRDIAASVSVIDRETIENTASYSALELIKDNVPGVYITEKGLMGYGVADGAAGGISIRGVGGSPVTGVLVLRDGRPDIMGMMGHPIPDAYPLEGLERIEVLRGPASFLYGTNAMGGVINLVTRDVDQPGFKTRVSNSIGSFNTQTVSIHHGAKFEKFDYHLSGGLRETDGHRVNSDYDGDHVTAHMGYRLAEKTRIEINANYSDIYLLDPGTESDPFSAQKHWYRLFRSGADLTIDHRNILGHSVLKLHGNFGRHRIYTGWRSNDRTIGVMFYHNAELWTGNTTTIGLDYKRYGGDAEDSINKIPFIHYDREFMTEYAPYVHMQQLVFSRFIASAGIRLERHEKYGSQLLPKFGLVAHITPATSVRVSASKGFRSPSIRELYVFPPRNENLEPEELWNSEMGIRQQIGKHAELDAVVFRAEGSNMIRMVYENNKAQFRNSGDFVHTGYELTARWHPVNRLRLTAGWSDMNLGDETRGAPEKKLTFNAGYTYKIVHMSVSLLHARDLFGSDHRQDRLPNYTLFNSSLSVDIWESVTLTAHLKNALDASYQTMLGYPMPGRTVLTRLSYSF